MIGKAVAGVAAGLVVAGAVVAPASATDWVKAFPPAGDIPASLGTYEAPRIDSGKAPKGGWFPCEAFTVPSAQTVVSAEYSTTGKTQKDVQARAYVYGSAAKAKQAYQTLQSKLSSCDGKRNLTASESEIGRAHI